MREREVRARARVVRASVSDGEGGMTMRVSRVTVIVDERLAG